MTFASLCCLLYPWFDLHIFSVNCTLMQLFTGLDSEFTSIYLMDAKSNFPHTLEDFIRDCGAMHSLCTDNAEKKHPPLFRTFSRCTSSWIHSKRHTISTKACRMQNPRHQTYDQLHYGPFGCPSHCWLLCMLYIIGLLKHLSNSKAYIPCMVLTGEVTDISPYLDYHFMQEVFIEDPSQGEWLAYWCGPVDKQGDFLSYNVLLCDTKKCVQCSNIHLAKFPNTNKF